jgi:DNA helicase-2/ATP-dependent DNA helicase PcrA
MAIPAKKTTKKKVRKAAAPTIPLVLPNDPLLEGLNDAQRDAVAFKTGPLLIVAGAGTGKTSVITKRIAHLVASGIQPDEILALTFTEKAATEMEERIDRELPVGYYDVWVSTFHGFCERILKQHALDIGLPNDFKTLSPAQQKILVRKNLDRFVLNYYRPLGNPTKFISAMVDHFSTAKDEEINPEQYVTYAESLAVGKAKANDGELLDEQEISRLQEIAHAYKTYQELLLENASLDFGDLIVCTLHLFRSRPRILAFYQRKFKYILVDEFQDTNFAQYELIKLLAAPNNNLTVVGDDDQSIYKFRGASISNILQFQGDYPAAREITLTENYRSGQAILDASHGVIQLNNPERLEAKLGISKKLKANIPETATVGIIAATTLQDEVDAVIKRILEVRNEKQALWNDFAILVRANNHAEPFTAKLSSLGLPYVYHANKGLYRKAIIVDILLYIRTLMNYHDSSSLYRVISRDPFCMPHADLMQLSQYGRKYTLSLYEALVAVDQVPSVSAAGQEIAKRICTLLETHGELIRAKTAGEAFVTIIKDMGIAQRIEPETVENAENRELIEQFYKKIETFEAENADKSMRGFLELLDFEQEAGEEGKLQFDPQSGPESVNILTIHASKGLEFKHVFVVNMVSRRFPSSERADLIELPKALVREQVPNDEGHIQEERRLLYVAMTRAKHGLYFSYAADMGGQRTVKPSQFLVELGLVSAPEKTAVLHRENIAAPSAAYSAAEHLPNTFSYTQLSDFKSCPMRYKYRHWLKLPLPGSAYLSFGNSIHKSLELFLSAYKAQTESSQGDLFTAQSGGIGEPMLPSVEDLLGLYDRNWVDEWYESKTQKELFRERGRQIIRSFYENFKAHPVVPKYIEKSFRLPIGEYFFTGKIDRADPTAEGLQIIDYKTGETERDLDKDGKNQLLIYQWAAQEYMKEKVSGLCYWYLYPDKFSEMFLGTNEELGDLKESILQTIHEIRDAITHDSFKALDKKAPRHNCEFDDLE